MGKHDRLRNYLHWYANHKRPWSSRYEATICGSESYAYLAGHYCGLLNDVLRLLGDDRVTALLDALEAADLAIADIPVAGVPADPTVAVEESWCIDGED